MCSVCIVIFVINHARARVALSSPAIYIDRSKAMFLLLFTVWLNTYIWEQSCAQPGVRWHEECRIFPYLSGTDSIKPSLLFSNYGCCISKGSPFSVFL